MTDTNDESWPGNPDDNKATSEPDSAAAQPKVGAFQQAAGAFQSARGAFDRFFSELGGSKPAY